MTNKNGKKGSRPMRHEANRDADSAAESSTVSATETTGALPRPPVSGSETEAAEELFPDAVRPYFPGTVRPADDGRVLFPGISDTEVGSLGRRGMSAGFFSQMGKLDPADDFTDL